MSQINTKIKLPRWLIILVVILTVILALAVTWAAFTDVIILRKTEDMAGSENAISILFVGNSQVFVGEVPRQLKTIARMHGIEIIYKDLSRHGASLSDSMDNAVREIQSGRYDYVVLNDQSRRPHNNIEGFFTDIQFLSDAVRESGAVPVLYNAAWANINGQLDVERQRISTEAYKRAADENDAVLVNVGDAWAYAYHIIPEISLYTRFDPRGPHANRAGGFFTACVFAATLFDLHIEDIPKDNRYRGSDAIVLAKAAWEFIHPSQ